MTYHRVCNKSNTTGDICGAGTAHSFGAPEVIPVFIGVRVSRSSVCVVICRFVLLSFFFWLLRCLSFFNLRLLITPLASSSFSFQQGVYKHSLIHPIINFSAPTWFVRYIYIYHWNLQFLDNVILIKTKVTLPQAYVTLVELGYSVWFYCSQILLFEHNGWTLFQKRAVCTKMDICVFITITGLIPLLVNY